MVLASLFTSNPELDVGAGLGGVCAARSCAVWLVVDALRFGADEAGMVAGAVTGAWAPSCLRRTRHCKAASHAISSSSDGAQTRYVRFGVMILKQCSSFLALPSNAGVEGAVVGESALPCDSGRREAAGGAVASNSIASRMRASGICRWILLSCESFMKCQPVDSRAGQARKTHHVGPGVH